MIQRHFIHDNEEVFYFDATEFCSYDDFYEMGSLPLDIYCQFLTPKHHFMEYISRTVKDVSLQHEKERRFVLSFKDGETKAMKRAAWMIVNAIHDNGLADERYTLMCIPASSRKKNQLRYKKFMRLVCRYAHIQNGYELVSVNSDRTEVHAGGSRQICNYSLPSDLSGRKVILFDDVETTGKTFAKFSQELENRGAEVVQGLFLAHAMPF